jgi:hypothetical protein
VEAIVTVDLVSVDEFEAVLVGVELLLVGELLLVVKVLLVLANVGELVAELWVVVLVAVDFISADEFEAVLLAVEVLLVGEILLVVDVLVLLSVVGELVIEL